MKSGSLPQESEVFGVDLDGHEPAEYALLLLAHQRLASGELALVQMNEAVEADSQAVYSVKRSPRQYL